MQIHYISEANSVLNHFLGQIRNIKVQNDSMRFRRNIERIGEVMAYELSKDLHYRYIEIQTPLGIKKTTEIEDQLVLCSILRAGLPLHLGFLNYFDDAENGFVSAYRYHPNNDAEFEIKVEYQAVPNIENKNLLLIDPMLATGGSAVAALDMLTKAGARHLRLVCIVAAPEGVAAVVSGYPSVPIFTRVVDGELNAHIFIVRGLGDFGDRLFGTI